MAVSKIVTWNGVPSTSIPGIVLGQVWRTLLGEPTGTYKKVPGRAGAWFFPGAPGTKEIRVDGFILSDTYAGRAASVEALSNWLDYNQEGKLSINDRLGIYYLATLGTPPDPEEWRELATFELKWIAQPYSFADGVTTETFVSSPTETHTWAAGLETPLYPVITLTPTGGTLTSFNIQSGGRTLYFQGLISSGSSVTINGIVPIVVSGGNTDTDLVGAVNMADAYLTQINGEFPVLQAGANASVVFTKTGGTTTYVTVDIVYRKTYRR